MALSILLTFDNTTHDEEPHEPFVLAHGFNFGSSGKLGLEYGSC